MKRTIILLISFCVLNANSTDYTISGEIEKNISFDYAREKQQIINNQEFRINFSNKCHLKQIVTQANISMIASRLYIPNATMVCKDKTYQIVLIGSDNEMGIPMVFTQKNYSSKFKNLNVKAVIVPAFGLLNKVN